MLQDTSVSHTSSAEFEHTNDIYWRVWLMQPIAMLFLLRTAISYTFSIL